MHLPKPGDTVQKTLQNAFEFYSTRPCLGKRKIATDGTLANEFIWFKYHEILEQSKQISSGIRYLNILKEKEAIGICGQSSIEWILIDLGSIFSNFITVPLHTSLDLISLTNIIQISNIKCIACSEVYFEKFIKISHQTPSLQTIILFDSKPNFKVDNPKSIVVFHLNYITEQGSLHPQESPIVDKEDLFTLRCKRLISKEYYLFNW